MKFNTKCLHFAHTDCLIRKILRIIYNNISLYDNHCSFFKKKKKKKAILCEESTESVHSLHTGGDNIGHREREKKINIETYLLLNGYRDRAVRISRSNPFRFFCVGLDKERSFTKAGEYIRRISRSHFGCCCPHKET